jgi:hypothetical protein
MLETYYARVARSKKVANGLDLLATACEATTPTQKENCKPSPDMVKALEASAKSEFGLRPTRWPWTETTKTTKFGQGHYRRRTVQVGDHYNIRWRNYYDKGHHLTLLVELLLKTKKGWEAKTLSGYARPQNGGWVQKGEIVENIQLNAAYCTKV